MIYFTCCPGILLLVLIFWTSVCDIRREHVSNHRPCWWVSSRPFPVCLPVRHSRPCGTAYITRRYFTVQFHGTVDTCRHIRRDSGRGNAWIFRPWTAVVGVVVSVVVTRGGYRGGYGRRYIHGVVSRRSQRTNIFSRTTCTWKTPCDLRYISRNVIIVLLSTAMAKNLLISHEIIPFSNSVL